MGEVHNMLEMITVGKLEEGASWLKSPSSLVDIHDVRPATVEIRSIFDTAILDHSKARLRVIDSPPSSGKTNYIKTLCLFDSLVKNKQQFNIISAPQRQAAKDLTTACLVKMPAGLIKGNESKIDPVENFNAEDMVYKPELHYDDNKKLYRKSSASALLKHVERWYKLVTLQPLKKHSMLERTAVACDATVVRFFHGLKKKSNRYDELKTGYNYSKLYNWAINNIGFYKDEAHKIKSGRKAIKDVRIGRSANKLGAILETICPHLNNNVLLVSATMFRHDQRSIIPEDFIAEFENNTRKISQYDWLKHCKYFKNLNIFVVCGHKEDGEISRLQTEFQPILTNVLKELHNLKAEKLGIEQPRRKGIVYLSPRTSNTPFRTDNKPNEVDNVCWSIRESLGFNRTSYDDENGMIILENTETREQCKVLDFVTEKRNANALKYYKSCDVNGDPSCFDYIIALERFKEAGNWEYCDSVIMIGQRKSHGEVYQICGRCMRDKEGKPFADAVQILHYDPDYIWDLENVNNWMTFLSSLMVLADCYSPIYLTARYIGDGKPKRTPSDPSLWRSLPLTDGQRRAFNVDFHKRLVVISEDLKSKSEFGDFKTKDIYSEFVKIAPSLIETLPDRVKAELSTPELVEEVIDDIYLSALRMDRGFVKKGLHIGPVAAEWTMGRMVEEFSPINHVQRFTGSIGVENLGQLRDIIERPRVEAEQAVKDIIEFRNKNGRNPSHGSKDPYEKKLGSRLSGLKQAKKEKGSRIFYPSLQKLAEEAGYHGLFETRDLEANAIKDAEEIIEFINKNGRNPSSASKDPYERKLGSKLSVLKKAKQGKGAFYPSLQKLAEEAGYHDLFDNEDLEKEAIEKAKEIIEFRNKNGRNPSQGSKDPYEKKLGSKLSSFKLAKRGKGDSAFYPSLQKLAEDAGYPDLFDNEDLEKVAIEQVKDIIEFRNKNGRNPNKRSKDTYEKKLGSRLSQLKMAKQGKSGSVFYPSLQKLAEEAGYPDLFDNEDFEKNAIEQAKEIIEFRNKNGRNPSYGSKDPYEKKLGNKLSAFKQAKKEKRFFYPSLQKLADDAGYPDLFEPVNKRSR